MTTGDTTSGNVKLNRRYGNIKQRAHDRAKASKNLADTIKNTPDLKKLSKEHLRLLEDYINDRQIEGREADVRDHITKRDQLRSHLRQKILGFKKI